MQAKAAKPYSAISQLPITNYRLLLIGGRTGTSDPTNQAYAEQLITRQRARHLRSNHPHGLSLARRNNASILRLRHDGDALRRRRVVSARDLHGVSHTRHADDSDATFYLSPSTKHGENIFFISSGSPFPLSSAISELANDFRPSRSTLARRVEVKRRFTWDKIAKRTGKFFERVLIETR